VDVRDGSRPFPDAFRGLLSISPDRKIELLADGVNGDRMLFPNDLAIAADEPNRDPPVAYIPFGYEKKILPRGWQKTPLNKPLDLDIIFEKDVEIVMRDGVKVRPKSESLAFIPSIKF